MKKNYFLLFASLLLFNYNSIAQNFDWAVSFHGAGNNQGNDISVTNDGYIYSTGFFFSTADFNPDTTSSFNLTAGGSSDIYISKLDTNGNFIWAKSFSGTGFFKRGHSITTDNNGNVYITGRFSGTVDFDPDTGTYNITSSGGFSSFVSKLDSNGSFVWAVMFSGNGTSKANSIIVSDSGYVYTTGEFAGIIDFDPSSTGTTSFTSIGATDVFVSKLDANGLFVWARVIAGNSLDMAHSIALDSFGNCFISGEFSATVDMDPGTATYNVTSNGGQDIFLLKLNAAGNFQWVATAGSTAFDKGLSVVVDQSNDVYYTGVFRGVVDFDPGSATANLTASNLDDIFICKLTNAGNFAWAKSIGGQGIERSTSLSIDHIGNLYLTGEFNDQLDFDPSSSSTNRTPVGNYDGFLAKYRDNGDFVWVAPLGGSGFDIIKAVAINQFGSVFTTGKFNGTADFDPGSGTFNLTSQSSDDIFIQKLSQCILDPTQNNQNVCDGDTLTVGLSSYTEAGNYIDVLVTANGCDSAIFTNLNIVTIDASFDTSVVNTILRANQSGATYQWLDCNNAFAPLVGDTSQSYTVTANGTYAVEITLNGCVDTSTCEPRIVVGLENQLFGESIAIYPNPASTSFTIQLPKAGRLDIYDIKGKLISSDLLPSGNTVRSTDALKPGIYFIRYTNDKSSLTNRLVVID